MALTAIALLRLTDCSPSADSRFRVERLADAVLVHTQESFASEPDELARVLAEGLGEQLAAHVDERGIFIVPSVAKPIGKTYAEVVAEFGEAGMWLPMPAEDADSFALPDGLGALGAVLGSMVQHMPQSLLEAAGAAARGDHGDWARVTEQVSSALGQGFGPVPDMASMLQWVQSSGLDVSSPMFQQLLGQLQDELARDPQKVARLAEQLFGGTGRDSPDE